MTAAGARASIRFPEFLAANAQPTYAPNLLPSCGEVLGLVREHRRAVACHRPAGDGEPCLVATDEALWTAGATR